MAKIIIYILILFASFSIGRVGHILGGHLNTPHHWIYGAVLFLIGIFLYKKAKKLFWIFLAVGIGLIISDLKDLLSLEFWGVDEISTKNFWGID